MLEKKEYAINLHLKIAILLMIIVIQTNSVFVFSSGVAVEGSNRNTWPPAQASSCGNLSTLQPTGDTPHISHVAAS